MRKLLIILGILIVLVPILLVTLTMISAGERKVAREFLIKLTGGDYAAAQPLLHPEVRKKFTEAVMQEKFGAAEPYAEVSFNSFEAASGLMKLQGMARTESGCASKVEFELIDEQITFFSITPICTREN